LKVAKGTRTMGQRHHLALPGAQLEGQKELTLRKVWSRGDQRLIEKTTRGSKRKRD